MPTVFTAEGPSRQSRLLTKYALAETPTYRGKLSGIRAGAKNSGPVFRPNRNLSIGRQCVTAAGAVGEVGQTFLSAIRLGTAKLPVFNWLNLRPSQNHTC